MGLVWKWSNVEWDAVGGAVGVGEWNVCARCGCGRLCHWLAKAKHATIPQQSFSNTAGPQGRNTWITCGGARCAWMGCCDWGRCPGLGWVHALGRVPLSKSGIIPTWLCLNSRFWRSATMALAVWNCLWLCVAACGAGCLGLSVTACAYRWQNAVAYASLRRSVPVCGGDCL